MALLEQCNSKQADVRFVVGSVSSVDQAAGAVADLLTHDVPRCSLGMLAKQKLLSHEARLTPTLAGDATSHAQFNLLASREDTVLCFGRSLRELLQARISEGSTTLDEALQRWLLPRHASSLSDIVEKDGILIWVQISNPEEERSAALSLLRNSHGTVGVHDFGTRNCLDA